MVSHKTTMCLKHVFFGVTVDNGTWSFVMVKWRVERIECHVTDLPAMTSCFESHHPSSVSALNHNCISELTSVELINQKHIRFTLG